MLMKISGPPQWRGGIFPRPVPEEPLFLRPHASPECAVATIPPSWTMLQQVSGPLQWRDGIVLRPVPEEPLFLRPHASPWRAQPVDFPSCTMRVHSLGPPQWRDGIVPRPVPEEPLFLRPRAFPWRAQPAAPPSWSIRLHFALSAESVPDMSCLHQGVAVVHRGFYLSVPLSWRRTMPRQKAHCRFWGIHSG